MEDFITFEIAKKLKEKGFDCKYPFAMYNEDGNFFPLYSSDKYYYEINDFDENDFIAPTIEQVLKWLRNNKKTIVSILPVAFNEKENKFTQYYCTIYYATQEFTFEMYERPDTFETYEECALNAIEYVINNLI